MKIQKAIQNIVPDKNKLQFKEINIEKINGDINIHPMTNFISETGLYRLIFKSKQKNALEFQDWVVEEVLPKLRKNGSYELTEEVKFYVKKLIEEKKKLENDNDILKEKLDYNIKVKKGIIYARKTMHNGKKFYKIGYTLYPKKRDKGYGVGQTINEGYDITYDSDNPYLAEKIAKHKLIKCQYRPSFEIYFCDFKTINRVLKEASEAVKNDVDEEYIMSDSETETYTESESSFKIENSIKTETETEN